MNPRTHKSDDGRFITDEQLAAQLNVGVSTARKIAIQAGARRRIGSLTRNEAEVVYKHISNDCVVED